MLAAWMGRSSNPLRSLASGHITLCLWGIGRERHSSSPPSIKTRSTPGVPVPNTGIAAYALPSEASISLCAPSIARSAPVPRPTRPHRSEPCLLDWLDCEVVIYSSGRRETSGDTQARNTPTIKPKPSGGTEEEHRRIGHFHTLKRGNILDRIDFVTHASWAV